MHAPSAAAKPYARALHDLAKERKQAEAIVGELQKFADLTARQVRLREFLARPWVSAEAKRAVAVEVATRLGLSRLVRDFVGLVARQGRAGQLEAIAEVYRDLVDRERGRVRARVRTAVVLTEAELQSLQQRLGRAMGGTQAVIEETVDSEMLGGFVAEIGSFIVDGSLDGQLAQVRERLARGQG